MPTNQHPAAIELTDNEIFVFTHIPKTAGMTFKRLLEGKFPAGTMPKIGPDYQASADQIKSLADVEKAGVRCLSGHMPYGVHRFFPQRTCHYVSFVRDPVDRTLSEYFFLLKRPQLMPLIGLDADAHLSPEEFLKHQVSLGMMDFQTRVLSGYDDMIDSVLPPYKPMAVTDADAFIDGILRAYAFLGTLDRFDESLLLMKQQFGWRSVCYISRNVGAGSTKRAELKQALAEEIRSLNPLDCKLVARVRESIEGRIAAQGETFPDQLRRFRSRNRLYSHGWALYRATGLRRLWNIVGQLQKAKARQAHQKSPTGSANT